MIRALDLEQVSPSPRPRRYDWNYSKVTSSKVGQKFCIFFKQNHTVDGNQKSGKKPVEGKVVEIPLFYTRFSTIQPVVGLGISEPSTTPS